MKKRNGFTLIELLAVIVILAIIALIATPMVLKYIKTARKGSYDTSIDNILRAADNYYASSLLDNNATYPLNFVFPKNKDLGVKGKQPDSGYLTLYEDGSTYLYAVYDDIVYTKLPNETKASRYDVVIGDDITWTTDGKGKITKYNGSDSKRIEYQLSYFISYGGISVSYAMRDTNSDLDFNLSLMENIELLEKDLEFNRSSLPLELNKELDEIFKLFDTDSAITEEEAFKMIEDNRAKIPCFADYLDFAQNGGTGKIEDLLVYQLIKNNLGNSNLLVIPNHVKHSDGTIEKITSIGAATFRVGSGLQSLINCSLAPETATAKGMEVVISEGIEEIEGYSFGACLLNSVNIGNTVKTIGDNSFYMNLLSTVILPNSLENLGGQSFIINNIEGDIVIPKSIKTIGAASFASGGEYTCSENSTALELKLCEATNGKKNNISRVTFEKGSKIEMIQDGAFDGNSIETITIPGSIKNIGSNAFNCPTLKSATIERAKGSDLTVDSTAFGSITPVYKP